jgi:t-SNARE complex subunit (syntaxin)
LRQPLLQQTVSGVSSYDTDAALIEERNRDMREIEGELSALRDVMRDVKGLVDEGRDQLDIVEEQVVVSDIRVEKGIDDLTDVRTPPIFHFMSLISASSSSTLLQAHA